MKTLLFVLFSSLVSHANECRITVQPKQELRFQYDGWTQTKNFDDAPAAEYSVITNFDPKNLPKGFRQLPRDLRETLEEFHNQGTPVLLFSHDTIGGFVTQSNEKFSKVVSQKLGLPESRPLIALNTNALQPEIVAHELVHLRDEMDGTATKIRDHFEAALGGSSSKLSQLLVQYVLEYRAENETLFYGKNINAIMQNYEYASYANSAAQTPNEIFYQTKKLFQELSSSQQKELKLKLNQLLRVWTKYPKDEKHIKTNQL